ncbi:TPA: TcpQ domain-containing protein [Proteus mirabilis]|nr:TcpQ domain-containing protein [Proteus mirabilis]HCT9193879.1 TcpQ domain-containing protein [Proteus mirabilis]HCT9196703.1 TcpQ domain-containing protein [Proteus mirabilis]HCT9201543.1 TcpQ domain-containing protein [Proteus mirabilis]HEI8752327.1 TcpQ domain-containing protein [Proteus mirabilis]
MKKCSVLLFLSIGIILNVEANDVNNNSFFNKGTENNNLQRKGKFLSNNVNDKIEKPILKEDYFSINPIGELKNTEAKKNNNLVLKADNLLSQQIKDWSLNQGYKLMWKSKKDYLIYNDIYITGSENNEVLDKLGYLLSSQDYNFNIKLFKNNNVLVIEEN